MNIIKTARIRLSELYQDSINFIKQTYDDAGQYFTYDSHENLDEICYNIKPEYQKVFKKLQGELNKKLQGELNR